MKKEYIIAGLAAVVFAIALFTQIDWKQEAKNAEQFKDVPQFGQVSSSNKQYQMTDDFKLLTKTKLTKEQLEIQDTKGCVACHEDK